MRSISSLLGSGDVVEGKGKFHERKTEISHLFSHLVREVIKLPGKTHSRDSVLLLNYIFRECLFLEFYLNWIIAA